MGIFNIIYIVETVIVAIAIITGLIIYEKKHKKSFLKFLGISLGSFVLVFGITFVLEKPEMQLSKQGDVEVYQLEVCSNDKVKMPKTTYHFGDVTDQVQINGNIDYNKIGEYDIKFEVDTLFGKYSKPAKVKIVDIKAPVIQLEGGDDFKQSYAKEYQEPGFKAADEYEGDLTEKVISTKQEIDENNYKIIYTVEDSSGNKAEVARNITIVDDVAPVISLIGNATINLTPNSTYEEQGAKAQDEKDGDLTANIKTEGSVDTSKEGTYTITYKVADNSGNEAIEKRTIEVRAYVPPVQAQSGSGAGTIYLTFDDGPTTNITPQILDVLASRGVKATFFILNYNAAGEELVKREYNEGHTVAIHGYSHDYNTIYRSEEAYMSNIIKLQEKIKASTGYTATITRFPGGSSNTVSKFNPGIMTRLCRLVQQRGFKYFDWNVSSGDAGGARNADDVYNNVVTGLSKSRANVVLMHDFSSNQKGADALGRIIDYGIANGYTFSRITEDTAMVTHTPNN